MVLLGDEAPRRSPGARAQRHLLVDTQGLLLKVVVHPAHLPNLHDRLGAKLVVGALGALGALGSAFPRLRPIYRSGADQGYAGALGEWSHEQLGIDLEVVSPWGPLRRQLQRYAPLVLTDLGFRAGFHVLPSSRAAGSSSAPSPGWGARAS
jgi:putative transposase